MQTTAKLRTWAARMLLLCQLAAFWAIATAAATASQPAPATPGAQITPAAPATGQVLESLPALEAARLALWQAYHGQLAALAAEATAHSETDLAEQLASWRTLPEPASSVLFLPPPSDALYVAEPAQAAMSSERHKKFEQLRVAQAEAAFALSRRALDAQHYALSLQLVYETLRENPEHALARKILGYQRVGQQWLTQYEADKVRAGNLWHPRFGWLHHDQVARYELGQRFFQGRWISASEEQQLRGTNIERGPMVMSEHFGVRSGAGLEAAVALVNEAEPMYHAWRQLFFDYYMPAARAAAALRGEGSLEPYGSHKFEVVLFGSRDDYLTILGARQPNIGVSVGYYDYDQRKAYFYQGIEPRYMFHELAHQMFSLSRPTVSRVGIQANYWLVEGSACFFESFKHAAGQATLGGLEGGRMNSARGVLVVEKFYVPWAEMCGYGRAEFQQGSRLPRLYAQAAGMTHFLMYADRGKYRSQLMPLLIEIFSGKDRADSLQRLYGQSFEQLDEAYKAFISSSPRPASP